MGFLYQRQLAQKLGSPVFAVDAQTWLVDGVLYAGETGAFIVYLLLKPTALGWLLPYADPIFVLIVVGVLMKVPIKTIREGLREVLHRAPRPDVQLEVRQRLATALAGVPVRAIRARMVEVGRFFFILVHVVVDERFGIRPISELDEIRRRMEQSLRGVHPRLALDVIFTADNGGAAVGMEPLMESTGTAKPSD